MYCEGTTAELWKQLVHPAAPAHSLETKKVNINMTSCSAVVPPRGQNTNLTINK